MNARLSQPNASIEPRRQGGAVICLDLVNSSAANNNMCTKLHKISYAEFYNSSRLTRLARICVRLPLQ
jgi:hypothetical protein